MSRSKTCLRGYIRAYERRDGEEEFAFLPIFPTQKKNWTDWCFCSKVEVICEGWAGIRGRGRVQLNNAREGEKGFAGKQYPRLVRHCQRD